MFKNTFVSAATHPLCPSPPPRPLCAHDVGVRHFATSKYLGTVGSILRGGGDREEKGNKSRSKSQPVIDEKDAQWN